MVERNKNAEVLNDEYLARSLNFFVFFGVRNVHRAEFSKH